MRNSWVKKEIDDDVRIACQTLSSVDSVGSLIDAKSNTTSNERTDQDSMGLTLMRTSPVETVEGCARRNLAEWKIEYFL